MWLLETCSLIHVSNVIWICNPVFCSPNLGIPPCVLGQLPQELSPTAGQWCLTSTDVVGFSQVAFEAFSPLQKKGLCHFF